MNKMFSPFYPQDLALKFRFMARLCRQAGDELDSVSTLRPNSNAQVGKAINSATEMWKEIQSDLTKNHG